MRVCEIAEIIEKIAPVTLAEEWDNVGLLVGDYSMQVSGIVIALDLTDSVINECIAKKCNLIITHHPAIFDKLDSLVITDYTSNLIIKCIQNNINVYSAHTNMDMSDKGINFEMAKLLGVKPNTFLSDGLGVYGEYDDSLAKLLLEIQKITKENEPKIYKSLSSKDAEKHKIAYIGGSGGRIEEIVSKAKELGITTIISSEFKHNILLELVAQNVNIIQIGHFESEIIFVDIIYNLLKSKTDKIYKYVDFK